jgi:hypothetical protein
MRELVSGAWPLIVDFREGQTPNQSWGMVKEEIYSHNTFSKIQPKLQHTTTTPQQLAQLVIM